MTGPACRRTTLDDLLLRVVNAARLRLGGFRESFRGFLAVPASRHTCAVAVAVVVLAALVALLPISQLVLDWLTVGVCALLGLSIMLDRHVPSNTRVAATSLVWICLGAGVLRLFVLTPGLPTSGRQEDGMGVATLSLILVAGVLHLARRNDHGETADTRDPGAPLPQTETPPNPLPPRPPAGTFPANAPSIPASALGLPASAPPIPVSELIPGGSRDRSRDILKRPAQLPPGAPPIPGSNRMPPSSPLPSGNPLHAGIVAFVAFYELASAMAMGACITSSGSDAGRIAGIACILHIAVAFPGILAFAYRRLWGLLLLAVLCIITPLLLTEAFRACPRFEVLPRLYLGLTALVLSTAFLLTGEELGTGGNQR